MTDSESSTSLANDVRVPRSQRRLKDIMLRAVEEKKAKGDCLWVGSEIEEARECDVVSYIIQDMGEWGGCGVYYAAGGRCVDTYLDGEGQDIITERRESLYCIRYEDL
ncbi:hypothetical protein Tco_1030461 [Tanacetum coccineum]|uniref:Uncharacterized protein n=1 Tax=Tanacetum coccineum TaxID=301880 RepID=A0ABQ5G7Q8_9ASTR